MEIQEAKETKAKAEIALKQLVMYTDSLREDGYTVSVFVPSLLSFSIVNSHMEKEACLEVIKTVDIKL